MAVVLYSTSWTADAPVGEAIVEILVEELRRRGIGFRVVETKWSDTEFAKLLGDSAQSGTIVNIEVDDDYKEEAEKCLSAVYEDTKKLKETALAVARTKYIKDERELMEYRRGLEETYGW